MQTQVKSLQGIQHHIPQQELLARLWPLLWLGSSLASHLGVFPTRVPHAELHHPLVDALYALDASTFASSGHRNKL